jgi:hypothetical protein
MDRGKPVSGIEPTLECDQRAQEIAVPLGMKALINLAADVICPEQRGHAVPKPLAIAAAHRGEPGDGIFGGKLRLPIHQIDDEALAEIERVEAQRKFIEAAVAPRGEKHDLKRAGLAAVKPYRKSHPVIGIRNNVGVVVAR